MQRELVLGQRRGFDHQLDIDLRAEPGRDDSAGARSRRRRERRRGWRSGRRRAEQRELGFGFGHGGCGERGRHLLDFERVGPAAAKPGEQHPRQRQRREQPRPPCERRTVGGSRNRGGFGHRRSGRLKPGIRLDRRGRGGGEVDGHPPGRCGDGRGRALGGPRNPGLNVGCRPGRDRHRRRRRGTRRPRRWIRHTRNHRPLLIVRARVRSAQRKVAQLLRTDGSCTRRRGDGRHGVGILRHRRRGSGNQDRQHPPRGKARNQRRSPSGEGRRAGLGRGASERAIAPIARLQQP